MTSKARLLAAIVSLALVLAACTGQIRRTSGSADLPELILATTTSTQDSGLLDVLVPEFEKRYPAYRVKTIAVGSGEALAMGRRGDADVLLVHAPAAELEFMAAGAGASRKPVMHNWFLLVGPPGDPASARGSGSVEVALSGIAARQAAFVSRGDESGTHKKELALWQEAGVRPVGPWYIESGQGMGETLRIADEKAAYTLADEGTYLSQKTNLSLVPIVSGAKGLKNAYSVIVVSRRRFPRVNKAGAEAFSRYVTGAGGRSLIGRFGRGKYGKALFTPDGVADGTDR